MHLTTAGKMRIARALSVPLRAVRRLAGRGGEVRCRRRAVTWRLDLDEGVQLALFLGVYERSTWRVLRRLVPRGGTVLDIGANIGAHTLPLAAHVGPAGQVLAIEAADAATARLRRNLALNPDLSHRVRLFHLALARPGAPAAAEYYSTWPLGPTERRHPLLRGAPQVSSAESCTLDDLTRRLQLGRIDLIKLDVDGFELDVLEGAKNVLATLRPRVVFELCPYLLEEQGACLRDLRELFEAHRYRILSERLLELVPSDLDMLLRAIPRGGGLNLIAQPLP